MPSIQHLQRERDDLQAQYELLSEKISRLRKAQTIETDVASRFKQERQLEQAETERAKLLIKIEELEAKIKQWQTEPKEISEDVAETPRDIWPEPGMDKEALRQRIAVGYSLQGVKTLCEDCGVDYEELGVTEKTPLIRELIRELERRGQLAILVEKVTLQK